MLAWQQSERQPLSRFESMKPIRLNPEQQKAVKDMIEFVTDGTQGSVAFMGAAGTGKTTVLQHFARNFIDLFGKNTIFFVTPTHKAAGVLRKKMPGGIKVWTVAKTIGMRATKNKDKLEFVELGVNTLHRQFESLKKEMPDLKLIVVDESSMVSQDNANSLAAIAELYNNKPIIFTGDPYQLPPIVSKIKSEDELETEDEQEYSKNMCSQFTQSSYKIILKKVMRHNGPILDYATSIRENFKQVNKFPLNSQKNESSLIDIFDSEAKWMQHFFASVQKNGLNTRAITHKNSNCAKLTNALRYNLYGNETLNRWTEGENITFPNYIKLPCGQAIFSCSDAQIKLVEIVDLEKEFLQFSYVTPVQQLQRSFSIYLKGQFQKLTVLTETNKEYTVFTPLIGSSEAREHRTRIRAKLSEIAKTNPIKNNGPEWEAMSSLNTYFPVIYSANVMTVHKSQGSSFKYVYGHKDIEECKSDYSNSLLYVAATRAKEGLYLFKP